MRPLPGGRVSARAARLWLFVTILAVDQVTKAGVLAYLAEPIRLGPLLNLVHVRNFGIGFGFLGDGGTAQQWVLAGFALTVAVVLVVMQARTDARLYATGLMLIASGAVGNAICRLARGSVVDFIDVHVSGYHWPAFNVADTAITVGALCVIAHALPLQEAVARLRPPPRGR